MDRRLLTTTAYFPPAHWFTAAAAGGEWLVEAHENYQKRSWRHRCQIAGPNKLQTLTVPLVKGKHGGLPIQEVRISYDEDWPRLHRQAITTAYGRAPYFEYYADGLFALLEKRPALLWTLNTALIDHLVATLGWPVAATPTVAFVAPTAGGYLRPADLPLSLPPYPQPFADRHGFRGGLSILDALFCLGPELIAYA